MGGCPGRGQTVWTTTEFRTKFSGQTMWMDMTPRPGRPIRRGFFALRVNGANDACCHKRASEEFLSTVNHPLVHGNRQFLSWPNTRPAEARPSLKFVTDNVKVSHNRRLFPFLFVPPVPLSLSRMWASPCFLYAVFFPCLSHGTLRLLTAHRLRTPTITKKKTLLFLAAHQTVYH